MWTYGPGMMGYGGWYGMGGGMLLGGIFWIVLWVFIIFVVVHFLRTATRGTPQRRPAALDVLEERYARGEIGRDEYLEKKRDLTSTG